MSFFSYEELLSDTTLEKPGEDSKPNGVHKPNGTPKANGVPAPRDGPAEMRGANGTTSHRKKSLILNAFVEMCSGHQSPGLWRHPQDRSANFNDVEHWVNLAKMLEAARIHGIFIADVLGMF